jgi:hypothetical protein
MISSGILNEEGWDLRLKSSPGFPRPAQISCRSIHAIEAVGLLVGPEVGEAVGFDVGPLVGESVGNFS